MGHKKRQMKYHIEQSLYDSMIIRLQGVHDYMHFHKMRITCYYKYSCWVIAQKYRAEVSWKAHPSWILHKNKIKLQL